MIETITQLCPSFKPSLIEFTPHSGYFLIGCSATNFGGRLLASVWGSDHVYNPRLARYEQFRGNPHGRPGNPRSDRPAYLVGLTDDLKVESIQDIITPDQFAPGGFDGLKPFEWRDRLWCDFYTGGYGTVRMFMARIDYDAEQARLTDFRQLTAPGPRRDEKNWMPETTGATDIGTQNLVYHYDVCTVAKRAKGAPSNLEFCPADLYDKGHHHWKNLHGGTQVVDGLAIVHDYRYVGSGRVYRHYFVRFHESGVPIALSRPFVLQDVEKVEVVTGLAKHPDGRRFVVSFGPAVATVDIADVHAMPWDGEPQAAPPARRPPPSPGRIRPPRIIGHPRRRPGEGVKA